jgi:hypothetical protein
MSKSTALHFNCPNCNALCQIIKAEAGPETRERDIACRICGGPLPGREGQFILNIFSYGKPSKARNGSASPFPASLIKRTSHRALMRVLYHPMQQ